ncbi:hypothetical protein BH24ACT22_BH24ACT22_21890 [soil metagenome]
MQTELLQFAGARVAFLIILILWLRIIYLPARTVERWEDQRPKNRRRRG